MIFNNGSTARADGGRQTKPIPSTIVELETLHGKEKANKKTVVQIAAIYEADTDLSCIFSRKRGSKRCSRF
jgi:hypothetical protein